VDSLSLGRVKKGKRFSTTTSPDEQTEKILWIVKDVSAARWFPPTRFYYGGEIGVFYGHATGKFGGDAFGGYVIDGWQRQGADHRRLVYEEMGHANVPRFRPLGQR